MSLHPTPPPQFLLSSHSINYTKPIFSVTRGETVRTFISAFYTREYEGDQGQKSLDYVPQPPTPTPPPPPSYRESNPGPRCEWWPKLTDCEYNLIAEIITGWSHPSCPNPCMIDRDYIQFTVGKYEMVLRVQENLFSTYLIWWISRFDTSNQFCHYLYSTGDALNYFRR